MSDNILSDFTAFIEKSAQMMNAPVTAPIPAPSLKATAPAQAMPQQMTAGSADQAMGGMDVQKPAIMSAQGAPRQSDTDRVNNTMSAGVSNPSHGGAEGMPKAVTTPGQPLKKSKAF